MVWCCLNAKKTCNDEIIIETSERLLITDGKRSSNSWSSEKVSGGNSVVNLLYNSYDSRKRSDDTVDDSAVVSMDQVVIRQPTRGEDILIKTNSSAVVAYSNKNDSVKSEGSPIATREKLSCTSTQTEANVIAAPLMKIREKSRMIDSTDNDELINGNNKKDKKIGNDEIINVKKEAKPCKVLANKKDQSTSPMKNEEPVKEKDDEESMYENTPHYAQNLPRINHNKRHSQNKDGEQNKNRKSCFSGKYTEITEDVGGKEVLESTPLDLSNRRERNDNEPLDLCTKRDESLGIKPDLLSSCGDDIANDLGINEVSHNFHKYTTHTSYNNSDGFNNYNIDGYNSYNNYKRYNTSKSNEHGGYYHHQQQAYNKPHTLHQTHFISAQYRNIQFNNNNIYVNESITTNTASYCNLPEPLYFQYDNNTYILPKKTKNNSSQNNIDSHDNTNNANVFKGDEKPVYKFNDKNIDNIDDYDSLDDYLMGGCEVISNTEALNLVIKPGDNNDGDKIDGKNQTENSDKTDEVDKGRDVKRTSVLLPVKVKCNINSKQIKNHHKKNEKKKKSKGKVKEDRKLSVEDIVVPARQSGSLSKHSIKSSTPKKKSRNIFNSFKNNYKNTSSIGSNLSSASSSSSLSCNYLHVQHHNNTSSLSNILNNNNSSLSNILDSSNNNNSNIINNNSITTNNTTLSNYNGVSYTDFNFTHPLDTYPTPPVLLANPTDHFLASNLKLLYMCPFYWGSLDVKGAEDVLMSHHEGSFIVRSSSDEDCVVSLSFKSLNSCHHTRVQYLRGTFSFHIATSDTTTPCHNIVHFISQAVDDCINSSNNILNINNNNNNSYNNRNNNSFNRNSGVKNLFKNLQEVPSVNNNNDDNNYWLYLERTRHGEVTRVPVKLFTPLLCPHAPSNEAPLPPNHKPPRVSSANQKLPSSMTPANHKATQATSRHVVSLRLLARRSLVATRSKQQVQKMAINHWLKGYILIGFLISQ